jgi:primosomal protein N' (replication factor Y) (superfamily II helicase)
MSRKFAQVVVNSPLGVGRSSRGEGPTTDSSRQRAFTYSIPERLAKVIDLGQLVWVPFGPRRIQGVVIAISDSSPVEQTKEIEEIVELRPFLSSIQIGLAHWIASTYLCSLYDAMQLMLPPGIEQAPEIYLLLAPDAPREHLGAKQAALVKWLAEGDRRKLSVVPRDLRSSVAPLVRSGVVIRRNVVPTRRARPKRVKSVRLISHTIPTSLAPHHPQADILEYLAGDASILPTVNQVCKAAGCSKTTLDALAKKGYIEIVPPRDLFGLTPKYFSDLPSLAPAKSRALVILRERNAPMRAKELKLSPAALHALESKGYLERIHIESTMLLKLTPSEARRQASLIRGKNRYDAIVSFMEKESKSVSTLHPVATRSESTEHSGGERHSAWISAVYAATGCTLRDLQKLEGAGVVALEEEEVTRDSLAGRVYDVVEPPELTPDQQSVWQEIASCLRNDNENAKSETYLLHGVTGSGKTEIYLRALAEIIAQGRQGIALVPEISLTPQTIQRFGARFKRIAVVHSKLSLGERYDTWRRCREGLIDVVIGSRSALFAPLPRLGVIVIDEEHEATYKQESMPHYHARQVAQELARRAGATLILGSATPDVETYTRATRREYKLLELPKRIMGHVGVAGKSKTENSTPSVHAPKSGDNDVRYLPLPPVEVVDLRTELKAGNRSIFSRALAHEMTRVLAGNEQMILFLNRRGHATFILCRDCGYVFKCKRCENPMTFHGVGNQLQCHHCGRRDRVPAKCPNCGSARIRYFGIGTEKVEEETKRLFPRARTLRWDLDVTRGKNSHELILEQFIQHRADVLIGTQMIAKGLDLPLVTLVGVISADTSLNLPDFRASERTFQLLTQVAGRSGRSLLGGKVIIQTYAPEHYAIQAASQHDYRAFYEREIAYRREQRYPPFSRLIRLLYVNASSLRAQEESLRLRRLLQTRVAQKGLPAIDLIGPTPAFFHRVRGEYRYQILVRGDDPLALLGDLAFPLGWRVDVDPVSLL